MATQNNSPSGWVGWAYFAAFMMMFVGILQGIAGLTGIFKRNFYVITQSHLLVFDFKTWGWINLIVGIIVFFAYLPENFIVLSSQSINIHT